MREIQKKYLKMWPKKKFELECHKPTNIRSSTNPKHKYHTEKTPRYVIIKLLKNRDEEKNLKRRQSNNDICRGMKIGIRFHTRNSASQKTIE